MEADEGLGPAMRAELHRWRRAAPHDGVLPRRRARGRGASHTQSAVGHFLGEMVSSFRVVADFEKHRRRQTLLRLFGKGLPLGAISAKPAATRPFR